MPAKKSASDLSLRKVIFLLLVALVGFFLGSKIGKGAILALSPPRPSAGVPPQPRQPIKEYPKSEEPGETQTEVEWEFIEKDGVRWVTPEEFKKAYGSQKTLILDLRSKARYEAGHIAGAESLPAEIVDDPDVILPKDANIILYADETGFTTVKEVLGKLAVQGIENAFLFSQTFSDWQKEGKSVETGDRYEE